MDENSGRQCHWKRCGMALALFAIPQIAQADTAPTVYDLPGINLVTVVRRPDLHRSDWSRTFDLGDQRFSIIGARAKSARAADRFALMPDNKIKSWSLSGRYDHDIGALGTIGLVGTVLVEKRRPWGLMSGGHALGSRTLFAGLEWTGEGREHIALGAFKAGNSGTRRGFDRLAELAAGAPLNASGLRFGGNVLIRGSNGTGDRETALGFDARLQRIALADATMIGGRASGTDSRLALTLRHRF